MAQSVKRAYSKVERWKLKKITALRAIFGGRPRIIFIHVPKTAGTTIRAHLRACLGSNGSGRAVGITDIPFATPVEPSRHSAGLSAQLTHGHMGWDSVEQLDHEKAFTFTFLRSPESRLRSLYVSLSAYTEGGVKEERLKTITAACKDLSINEIAKSRDPIILAHADNYVVRQLAGSVMRYPFPPSEWPILLERAIRNLKSLNFVGRQEHFREDFSRLMSMLNLPQHQSIALGSRNSAKVQIELDPRLYEWDQKLFDATLQN